MTYQIRKYYCGNGFKNPADPEKVLDESCCDEMCFSHGCPLKEYDGENLRPIISDFAHTMENVLRDNDHKGGWETCKVSWLFFSKLREELSETRELILTKNLHEKYTKEEFVKLLEGECADVANVIMMVGSLAAIFYDSQKGFPSADIVALSRKDVVLDKDDVYGINAQLNHLQDLLNELSIVQRNLTVLTKGRV